MVRKSKKRTRTRRLRKLKNQRTRRGSSRRKKSIRNDSDGSSNRVSDDDAGERDTAPPAPSSPTPPSSPEKSTPPSTPSPSPPPALPRSQARHLSSLKLPVTLRVQINTGKKLAFISHIFYDDDEGINNIGLTTHSTYEYLVAKLKKLMDRDDMKPHDKWGHGTFIYNKTLAQVSLLFSDINGHSIIY